MFQRMGEAFGAGVRVVLLGHRGAQSRKGRLRRHVASRAAVITKSLTPDTHIDGL